MLRFNFGMWSTFGAVRGTEKRFKENLKRLVSIQSGVFKRVASECIKMQVGDLVTGGDIIGSVFENNLFKKHR
jgi:hypothetical protein